MSRLLNSWFIVLSPVARALHQKNAPYGKFLLQTLLVRCLKKTTPRFAESHSLHQEQNFSCFSRLKNKQTCAHVAVIKLVVHRSLASCPGSSPKECSLWETPSPDTPDTLPQGTHNLTSLNRIAFDRKQNPFVYFVVTKLVAHSSLASYPGSSPKECSLWETPAPDTLGTLLQGNHTSLL